MRSNCLTSLVLAAIVLGQSNDRPIDDNAVGSVVSSRTNELCDPTLAGFYLIKSLSFDCKPTVAFEFSYVFVGQTAYNIKVCMENSDEPFQVALFNSHRDKLAAFTITQERNSFLYECSGTGIYYIDVINNGQATGAGLVSLSFRKLQ